MRTNCTSCYGTGQETYTTVEPDTTSFLLFGFSSVKTVEHKRTCFRCHGTGKVGKDDD